MISLIEMNDFLKIKDEICLIDVRTPSEYHKGHIPGSINIPLFDDDERKAVGTAYKQESRHAAVQLGLKYVGPKLSLFEEQLPKSIVPGEKLYFYCWRGGMRSESVAWVFEKLGYECIRIKGGYKAYKNAVRNGFAKIEKLRILSGNTGAGKTDILKYMDQENIQVIDLEGIANHKGSAFGAINEAPQPDSDHFENLLFRKLSELDLNEEIWVEDESINIGKVFLPELFFKKMREAPVLLIKVPSELRVLRLVETYTKTDKNEIIYSIQKIQKRLGAELAKTAIDSVNENDFKTAVEICLAYYDKSYEKSIERRKPELIAVLELQSIQPKTCFESLKPFVC